MRFIEVGGLRTPVIGLGTWQFASAEWGYGSDYAGRVAPALVRRAIELGVTLIDTAEVYGMGRSERIVGAAIAGHRDETVIVSKHFPFLPIARLVERSGIRSCERLGIDTIDLYLLHWPNPLVPQRSTMAGFRRLLDAGLVRHVGVSNHSLGRWRTAERLLGAPALANQVRFNLARPAPARDLVPYAAEKGRLIMAYSPLAQGFLASDDAASHGGGARRLNELARARNRERARPLIAALDEIARRHGATRAQVALAWVVAHPNTVAIPGARTIEQLEQNAAAADLALDPDEHARLTAEAGRLEQGIR